MKANLMNAVVYVGMGCRNDDISGICLMFDNDC